jgi:hypothetical protein
MVCRYKILCQTITTTYMIPVRSRFTTLQNLNAYLHVCGGFIAFLVAPVECLDSYMT